MQNFKGLSWMPIDIPFFQYKKELVADFVADFIPNTAGAFEAQRLTTKVPKYGISEWNSNLTESQRHLKEYIDRYLPFEHLVNIKLHHPHRRGSMHIDFVIPDDNLDLFEHNSRMEPCGFRMIIQGTRQGDLAVMTDTETVIPVMPESTDWYVIGHTNVRHGNTQYCPDRYVLFCHGWINKEKHTELLERSMQLYKDFAVWNRL